jgi:uncharacterized protein YuzE
MRITYDSEADAIMISFKEERVIPFRHKEIVPAKVIMSFDEHDNPVDLELLYVSQYVDDPTSANVIDLVQQAIAEGKR